MRLLLFIFAIPAAFAAVTAVGLAAALVGDGPLDVLAWLTLGLPLVPAFLGLLGVQLVRKRRVSLRRAPD